MERQSFYFLDNNGNILEGIVWYDLHNSCNEDFAANTFLKVNEMGFVVKEVRTFCDEINFRYGTDFFVKQPKGANFSVLGNETTCSLFGV